MDPNLILARWILKKYSKGPLFLPPHCLNPLNLLVVHTVASVRFSPATCNRRNRLEDGYWECKMLSLKYHEYRLRYLEFDTLVDDFIICVNFVYSSLMSCALAYMLDNVTMDVCQSSPGGHMILSLPTDSLAWILGMLTGSESRSGDPLAALASFRQSSCLNYETL